MARSQVARGKPITRQQVNTLRAELKRAQAAADNARRATTEAKADFKVARKKYRQLRKTAKECRKAAKALRRELKTATGALDRRKKLSRVPSPMSAGGKRGSTDSVPKSPAKRAGVGERTLAEPLHTNGDVAPVVPANDSVTSTPPPAESSSSGGPLPEPTAN